MTDFPFKVRKSTPDRSITIESRIEIAAASTSRSAIAVLILKYDETMEIKALIDMDDESA